MTRMETRLIWYGQSAFKIITPAGNVLLVDPWLTNPVFEKGKDEAATLERVDLILVTHGHSDHVGNAVEIGKRTRAKLVATYDLSAAMTTVLGYPADLANTDTTGHFGGTLKLLEGEVSVTFVPAWHGTAVEKDENSPPHYGGEPSGFVVAVPGGATVFYTRGTGFVFRIGVLVRFYKKEIIFVCVWEH